MTHDMTELLMQGHATPAIWPQLCEEKMGTGWQHAAADGLTPLTYA